MGINSIIKFAAAVAVAAALTGHLGQLTTEIRRAQIQLIHDSRASGWGSPDILYDFDVSRKNQSCAQPN